ncbi:MAG: hypothetical protein LBE79_05020 [Tannerella sp.]|jgi:hypothetical protein|nr:hypothetical protein [Tannerella sp.]
MSKTEFLSILFLLVTANIVAQSKNFEYRFSIDIDNAIEKDTVLWKYQMGANEYSFVGNYQKTLETWDKNGVGIPKITEEDSLCFIGFAPVNAKDYIIERSKNEQIIIINEAHTYPNHRTFTHSLLQGLYDNGYRYLGLEALFDTIINERKYPIIESGYYTKEPEFGNLIYTALNIGFTLFGYDYFEQGGKEREIAQSRNIVNFLEKHPHSKVLIHCGHDHVIKGTPNNVSWEKAMAGRLKEYTQINPFTIDQTQYAEKSDKKNTHPYIAMVNKDFPVILIDENENLFNGKKGNDQVDVRIIHPETQYINNRPNWLLSVGNRKEYHLESSKVTQYPLLVLAYRKNEFDNNGVPADIVEILENENIPSLILDKGSYEIIMKDRNYNIVIRYEIKIE